MDFKETLFSLCAADCAGAVENAAILTEKMLSEYCECERTGHTVVGRIKGESEYTLLLDAHIDEIAMTVTHIDDAGFVTVAPCGGIDLRTLPARVVTVHGKRSLPAVFCNTPPHLGGNEEKYDDISARKLDTMLGNAAKEQIAVGDTVTFRAEPCELLGNRITAKALDNRTSVACLLELASRFSEKKPPCSLVFLFSDQEELGLRGAKTAAFAIEPNEAVVLDVSFGDGPSISPDECGKLGAGAMVGVSPVLNGEISRQLIALAKENEIPYQIEVMGGATGTNADIISVTKSGIPTGLVSIPLRNMHTAVETVDLADLQTVCDLLERYILAGGKRE